MFAVVVAVVTLERAGVGVQRLGQVGTTLLAMRKGVDADVK